MAEYFIDKGFEVTGIDGSQAQIEKGEKLVPNKRYGFSLYAVEIKATNEMIGFVGLLHRTREEFDSFFMPATEISWRLSSRHWNCGFATEAALAVLDYAFNELELDEIVSFTAAKNLAKPHHSTIINLSSEFSNSLYG